MPSDIVALLGRGVITAIDDGDAVELWPAAISNCRAGMLHVDLSAALSLSGNTSVFLFGVPMIDKQWHPIERSKFPDDNSMREALTARQAR